MHKSPPRPPLLILAVLLAFSTQADATTVLKLDLEQMVARAGKIFRGTIAEINTGTIEAGGGTLPTVTYVINVEEPLKGEFNLKEGRAVIEVTMVGTLKDEVVRVGNSQRFSVLPKAPQLVMGQDYLLFTTPESSKGLSTAVGLGQGAFTIFIHNRQELAVNALDNANLGLPSSGPVPYSELAARIRTMLGK